MGNLNTLYRFRDLLGLWIIREVHVRYKQSLLGIAWVVLQPVALTIIFTVVFSRLVGIDTGGVPYPIFVYSALVPWTFFATSLSMGIPSLVNNMNLVTKVYFPREILPLASIGAGLLDFAVAGLVFVGLMLIYHIPLTLNALWVIPLLLIQIVLTIGVTLIGAALIVFYRDVRFIIPLLIQIWMYASPVIYPATLVPAQWQTLYFMNPMAGIIAGYRSALVLGEMPNLPALLLATVVSVALLLIGYVIFKRSEPLFADLI